MTVECAMNLSFSFLSVLVHAILDVIDGLSLEKQLRLSIF